MFHLDPNKRLYSHFDGCDMPLHEFLFSIMVFKPPSKILKSRLWTIWETTPKSSTLWVGLTSKLSNTSVNTRKSSPCWHFSSNSSIYKELIQSQTRLKYCFRSYSARKCFKYIWITSRTFRICTTPLNHSAHMILCEILIWYVDCNNYALGYSLYPLYTIVLLQSAWVHSKSSSSIVTSWRA